MNKPEITVKRSNRSYVASEEVYTINIPKILHGEIRFDSRKDIATDDLENEIYHCINSLLKMIKQKK